MYGHSPIKSGIDLLYDRAPDYFRLLSYRGPDNIVFLQRSDEALEGTATLSFRPGYINGEKRLVGYWSDLRFRLRKTRLRQWRELMAKLMVEEPITEFKGCRDFYLCIMDGNAPARRTLENLNDKGVGFKRFMGYSMVNILGRFPWHRVRPVNGVTVTRGRVEDLPEIIDFLERQHQLIPFGEVASEMLPYRLRNWQNFSLANFVLVRRGPDLIACAAAYDPSHVKRNVIRSWPWLMGLANFALGVVAPFLRARSMTLNEPLKVVYLTHLCFSHALTRKEKVAALQALVGEVFDQPQWADRHMLSFCDFEGQDLHRDLRGYLLQTEKMALYRAHSDEAPVLTQAPAAGFEMALV